MIALAKHYGLIAGLALAFVAGWLGNGWRMGEQLAEQQAEHVDRLRATAEANAAVIRKQQADRLELEGQLSRLDEQRYGELRHAQAATDRLAADLAATRQRLSVRAACPRVPDSSEAGSMDDGAERADIHPADAAAIVRITGDADACAVKLSALQEWAREVAK